MQSKTVAHPSRAAERNAPSAPYVKSCASGSCHPAQSERHGEAHAHLSADPHPGRPERCLDLERARPESRHRPTCGSKPGYATNHAGQQSLTRPAVRGILGVRLLLLPRAARLFGTCRGPTGFEHDVSGGANRGCSRENHFHCPSVRYARAPCLRFASLIEDGSGRRSHHVARHSGHQTG